MIVKPRMLARVDVDGNHFIEQVEIEKVVNTNALFTCGMRTCKRGGMRGEQLCIQAL